jgi:hypothetical protein
MGHCCLWETASLFGNAWFMGVHLITQPVRVLPCSNSAMKGNNGTNRILYHCIAAQTNTEQDCRLPRVFSKHKLSLMQGTAWRTTHLTISWAHFQLSDVQVLWSWHHCLCIWPLPAKLTSVFVEMVCKMGIHLCCSSSIMIFTHCSFSHLLSSHDLCELT